MDLSDASYWGLQLALERVPLGAHVGESGGWNRYNTDNEYVLSVWADGETYDLRVKKPEQ